jgi:hypothetical protein
MKIYNSTLDISTCSQHAHIPERTHPHSHPHTLQVTLKRSPAFNDDKAFGEARRSQKSEERGCNLTAPLFFCVLFIAVLQYRAR